MIKEVMKMTPVSLVSSPILKILQSAPSSEQIPTINYPYLRAREKKRNWQLKFNLDWKSVVLLVWKAWSWPFLKLLHWEREREEKKIGENFR